MTVTSESRPAEKVCDVSDCSAWKVTDKDYCHHHKGLGETNGAPEGNQNAMKTGLNSDPVNLFEWCAENESEGLAYILGKLWDYSKRAPHPVFEADVSKDDVESFEDIEVELTSYGDDVLFMCIRDYARCRAQKRQLKEGLITEQVRQGDSGVFTVDDANPVNLELDRMDKTTMRQKDKLGLMPSPESKQAEGVKELGDVVKEALEPQED
jgi:hypothetical protein